MKAKTKVQTAAMVVLVAALAGCFEPSGKNFEGAWVHKINPKMHPDKLDISCSGGYCDVYETSWDRIMGAGYEEPSFSKAKLKSEDVLVWEGLPLAAYFNNGEITMDGRIYIRREKDG
ncbi:hypothetical protein [Pseudomonas aeruginosa]|uniref:hypothetical protein n=1 Tax=Pseudomonas aeruginosa TaxID=287 RepID=UPI00129865C7|nr:hypothetical protein [Pseudomonas aeruginosa]